jgi:hypothetical protein
MKQYQSGYIVDDLFDIFEKKSSKQGAFKELTRWVSHFQVNSKSKFEEKKVVYQSSIAVLINLLQRGLPTKLNKHAIEYIVNNCSFLYFDIKDESSIILKTDKVTNEIRELIFRSLHLIDSRVDKNLH